MALTKRQKDQIILMRQGGSKISEIATIVKCSRPSVYRVLEEAGITLQDSPQDAKPTPPENTAIGEIPESEDKDQAAPATKPKVGERTLQRDIMERTQSQFVQKVSADLSTMMKDDMVISINAAAVIRKFELQQRAEVEETGLKWEEYLTFCLDVGYRLFQQALIRKIQEEEYEAQKITPDEMIEARIGMKLARM